MTKVTAAVVLTLLFGAQIAFAQSVYPSYYSTTASYQQPASGSCASISRDLSVGSRGPDVLSLQQFILTRNYPGSGSWMLTGYFGSATRAGVIDFQIDMHLPQTGVLDSATRATLSQMTCGYGYNQPTPAPYPSPVITQPWYSQGNYIYGQSTQGQCGWYSVGGLNYFNNCGQSNPSGTIYPNNTYPYNNYGGSNSPTISNVSGPTTLNVNTTGTWIVSVNNQFNSNFTSVSVNWGETQYGAYLAAPQQVYNSQSATFTHSYSQSGTYTITFTVSNGYGSNTSTVTVQVGGGSNYGTPTISYLSPSTAAVGTSVTIYGSGFSTTNNSIRFGNGVITGINSINGSLLSFVVPSTLSGYGYSQVTPGSYDVSVTNNSGNTSNVIPFTVNSYGINNNYNAPSITNVSGPTSLNLNTTGTWSVSVNNANSSSYTSVSANWGDSVYGASLAAPQQIYNTGTQTATFTHAYSQSGTYTVTFTVTNGYGSNTSTITVQVGGSSNSGTPWISYITPTSGSIGTQITIYGTGFNGDNIVHFGNGGMAHVTSASGNYIYYTVPSTLTPCTVQVNGQTGCPQYAQQVTPGQYPLYVTTNGNNSNSLTFTVQ